MQKRRILWDFDAWEDYLYWQRQDRKKVQRINQILRDIQRDPFEGVAKTEPLKGKLAGFWSRRIDEEHRLVYAVDNSTILIFACRGHYH